MDLGRWVLLVAVVGALGFGGWRAVSDGRFRGTHRVRGGGVGRAVRGGFETGAERPPQPPVGAGAERPPQPPVASGVEGVDAGSIGAPVSVLAGTAYDARRGERATLLQFSSAFCAPCRATRRILGEVATSVPGVAHVEVDAEEHLDLVRRVGVLRTPTTLVLDADGREITRATGAPKTAQVLAALDGAMT
jgi:thiol-disulfide isomerase/thioredoxin